MKKIIAVTSAVSFLTLVAFQLPVEKDSTIEKSLKEDLKTGPITEIQQPDMRVLDFDLESQ